MVTQEQCWWTLSKNSPENVSTFQRIENAPQHRRSRKLRRVWSPGLEAKFCWAVANVRRCANVDVLRYLPDISHLGDRKHICKSDLQRAILSGSVERAQYLFKHLIDLVVRWRFAAAQNAKIQDDTRWTLPIQSAAKTPKSRVFTLVTHSFSAICRGPIYPYYNDRLRSPTL